MKVDLKTLAYIQNVVETARLVKIENIIIEPDRVRALDEERSVVLFQDENVPILPFKAIGLNRIDIFMSRFEITKTFDNFEIEATMEDKGEFARALTMKGKGVKIDYRCANPVTIQAPKALNDTVKYKIGMTPETVLLLSKGTTAMGADEVVFLGDKDGVSFEMEDINKDKMTYKFADRIEVEGGLQKDAKFTFKYPTKILLALFKQTPDGFFFLTSKGMMKIVVNELNLYVPPRA